MPEKKPYRDRMKSAAFHMGNLMRKRIEIGEKKFGESWLNHGEHADLFQHFQEEMADAWNYTWFLKERLRMLKEYCLLKGLELPEWEDGDI